MELGAACSVVSFLGRGDNLTLNNLCVSRNVCFFCRCSDTYPCLIVEFNNNNNVFSCQSSIVCQNKP